MMIPRAMPKVSRAISSFQIPAKTSLEFALHNKTPQPQVVSSFSTKASSYQDRARLRGLAQKERQKKQATPTVPTKRLDVAIVGAPNAGKSQLLNALTQSRVAAVSRKRHTTRNGILGARTINDAQIVFVDTPGYLRSKSARKEKLVKELTESAGAEIDVADYTLLVIDSAKRIDEGLKEALVLLMLRAINARGRLDNLQLDDIHGDNNDDDNDEEEVIIREKFAIVLNKVDLVNPKTKLLEIATEIGTMGDACIMFNENASAPDILTRVEKELKDGEGEGGGQTVMQDTKNMTEEELEILGIQSPPIFYVSALKNDGVDDILRHLLQYAIPCDEDELLPPDQITTMSTAERVEEVLREKIYRCLHKEVPHKIKQVNQSFRKVKDPSSGETVIIIDHDLVVRTKSHQKLVKGKGGMTLKRIQETAKRDLEIVFECPVVLNLRVRLTKTQHDMPLDASSVGVQEFKMW